MVAYAFARPLQETRSAMISDVPLPGTRAGTRFKEVQVSGTSDSCKFRVLPKSCSPAGPPITSSTFSSLPSSARLKRSTTSEHILEGALLAIDRSIRNTGGRPVFVFFVAYLGVHQVRRCEGTV
jgi:hypothetical protein